jgi:ribosomal protein L37AE/L43A
MQTKNVMGTCEKCKSGNLWRYKGFQGRSIVKCADCGFEIHDLGYTYNSEATDSA